MPCRWHRSREGPPPTYGAGKQSVLDRAPAGLRERPYPTLTLPCPRVLLVLAGLRERLASASGEAAALGAGLAAARAAEPYPCHTLECCR